MNQQELTEVFRKLGAPDPEGWARSQINEGISQLAAFLILRKAWSLIVDEDDASWIEAEIKYADAKPDEPYAGIGHALKRLRALGVDNQDITDIVRGKQASLLFSFLYHFCEGGDAQADALGVGWQLIEVDQDRRPVSLLTCLHEYVLSTDPTGREMRPRQRT
jgi:hypothetical protein